MIKKPKPNPKPTPRNNEELIDYKKIGSKVLKQALAANPKTTLQEFKKQYQLNKPIGAPKIKINPFGAAGVKDAKSSKAVKKRK